MLGFKVKRSSCLTILSNGNLDTKMLEIDGIVVGAQGMVVVNNVPFFIRKSILGVCDVFFSPKNLSERIESITMNKTFFRNRFCKIIK